jgi:hypothetical protein
VPLKSMLGLIAIVKKVKSPEIQIKLKARYAQQSVVRLDAFFEDILIILTIHEWMCNERLNFREHRGNKQP